MSDWYGRSKFVTQFLNLWDPYKIGGNDHEMMPYGAVFCTRGGDKRDSPCVLARRACTVALSRCGRAKTRNNFSTFERRAK